MGFNSVFRSLQEIFPQVDVRILKAVAIEHSKDVDAAVESIIVEVLPAIYNPLELHIPTDDQQPKHPSNPQEIHTPADEQQFKHPSIEFEQEEQSFLPNHQGLVEAHTVSPFQLGFLGQGNADNTNHVMASSYVESSCSRSALHGGSDHDELSMDAETEGLIFSTNHQNTSHHVGSHHDQLYVDSENESLVLSRNCHTTTHHGGDDRGQVSEDAETKVHVFSTNCQNNYPLVDLSEGVYVERTFGRHEDAVVSEPNNATLHSYIQDLDAKAVYDSVSTVFGGNNEDDLHHLDIQSSKDETNIQHFQPLIIEEVEESLKHAAAVEKEVGAFVGKCTQEDSSGSLESRAEVLTFNTKMVNAVEQPHHTNIATRSGQTINIDFLEEFVTDAKSHKKTLLLAMQSVLNMLREVELREEAAEKAKEEAASGSLDILNKVNDLRQMLQHAKEANAMHSGEVYGERAILATEARELQSRLLILSDERERSLSIIDEMRHDLEERLAVAEAAKAAAEQERQEKVESAQSAVSEHKLLMDMVVEESKKLQQEAQENAKLREFLMDRGHIVDVLQGEIAVICEDVKTLQQGIDARLPVKKSLSSSQANYILASSDSSVRSASLDRAHEQPRSSESLKTTAQEDSCNELSEGPKINRKETMAWEISSNELSEGLKSITKENVSSVGQKVSSEDEWYLCDDDA